MLGATIFADGEYALGGRIVEPLYSPIAVTDYSRDAASSYYLSHPITEGVLNKLTTDVYALASAPQGSVAALRYYTTGYLIGA